jgi:hypothetical protein
MAFPIMILAEVALKIAGKTLEKKGRALSSEAVGEMARAIANDPVLKNEVNAEQPYQSRVAVGSVVAALGVVLPPLAALLGWTIDGSSIVAFGSGMVTLAGAGYALYGRFKSGLKPLFARG